MLSCLGFPGCRAVQFFPASVLDVKMDPSLCSTVRQLITIHVHAGLHPGFWVRGAKPLPRMHSLKVHAQLGGA